VVEKIKDLGVPVEFDVLPGISAPQLLAARHRIVLHEVGRPVHVTTGRRLQEAVAAGQDNIVAMLNPPPHRLDLAGLDDWAVWWGANLGDIGERLVAGRLGDVVGQIADARAQARTEAGWVMDVFLLRKQW
jgi:precorrin-6A synthase